MTKKTPKTVKKVPKRKSVTQAKVENLRSIVYTIKDELVDNEKEILYSLRSLDKFGKKYGTVFIIGRLPSFIKEGTVIHIPHKDTSYKEDNIAQTLLKACADHRVSKEFFHFNDDYFLTRDLDFSKMINHYRPTTFPEYIYDGPGRWNFYTLTIEKTWHKLKELGLSERFYDMHIPFLYEKDKVEETYNLVDWQAAEADGKGYTFRALYGNYAQPEATEMDDVSFKKFVNVEAGIKEAQRRGMFSINWYTIENCAAVLEKLYPEKSKFEK